MTLREEIVAYARSCIGTPFVHQGREPGVALDCVGLVVCTARRVLRLEADYARYKRYPQSDTYLEESARAFGFVETDVGDLRPGNVPLIAPSAGSPPHHVGILATLPSGAPSMIHAMNYKRRRKHRVDDSTNRVREFRFDGTQQDKVVAMFAFPGVE